MRYLICKPCNIAPTWKHLQTAQSPASADSIHGNAALRKNFSEIVFPCEKGLQERGVSKQQIGLSLEQGKIVLISLPLCKATTPTVLSNDNMINTACRNPAGAENSCLVQREDTALIN